jgi:hypothetical protein
VRRKTSRKEAKSNRRFPNLRNLAIVSSSGQTLYASALTDNSVLDVFAAGTNPLPVIIGGAKRDRLTFAGDLVLAAPTVYYPSGASEYVAGSLSLFAGFQRSTGEVSSVVSPLLSPGLVGSDDLAAPDGGYYSLSYSIHFVNALYDPPTGPLRFIGKRKGRCSFCGSTLQMARGAVSACPLVRIPARSAAEGQKFEEIPMGCEEKSPGTSPTDFVDSVECGVALDPEPSTWLPGGARGVLPNLLEELLVPSEVLEQVV